MGQSQPLYLRLGTPSAGEVRDLLDVGRKHHRYTRRMADVQRITGPGVV
jgi:hypothetical protein